MRYDTFATLLKRKEKKERELTESDKLLKYFAFKNDKENYLIEFMNNNILWNEVQSIQNSIDEIMV